jgi:hypothetical protein
VSGVRHLSLQAAVVLVIGLVAVGQARADDGDERSASPAVDPNESSVTVHPNGSIVTVSVEPLAAPTWYGWQVLAGDGAWVLGTAGCLAAGGDNLCLVPALGYLVAGPVIHGTHGKAGRAFGSAGLRAGLPLAGAVLGAAVANCSDSDGKLDFCGLGETALGFLAGMATAIVIDAVWAYDEPPVERVARAPSRPSFMTIAQPIASPTVGGATFGFAGRF